MAHSSNQKIGLATAIVVGMNAMIGAGIFAVPATLARAVGPAGILTYAFVILAVLCMALTLAHVAQNFPQEGSFYLYAKQWGGKSIGIIAMVSYIIGLIIAMGLLTKVAGSHLHIEIPAISSTNLGILALFALIVLNMIGVTLSQLGQIILICCTTFPLVATTILCFTHARIENLFPFMPQNPYNLITATRAVIFGFFGFECAASLFSVVKDPQRNVPKALTLAIIFVGTIYLLFVTSIILSIPLSEFANQTKLPQILAEQFPDQAWIANIINLSIISAVLGTLHSMIWSISILIVSFLKEIGFAQHTFFGAATDITKQRIVLVGLFTTILASAISISNEDLFFSFTGFCIVLAYIMGMGAIFKTNQTLTQKIITYIGFATALVIMASSFQGIYESLMV